MTEIGPGNATEARWRCQSSVLGRNSHAGATSGEGVQSQVSHLRTLARIEGKGRTRTHK